MRLIKAYQINFKYFTPFDFERVVVNILYTSNNSSGLCQNLTFVTLKHLSDSLVSQ